MSILFAGGGTLGSLHPLLAVAQELRSRNANVKSIFWTTRKPLEQRLVAEAGFDSHPIVAGKFRRYFSLWNVVDIFAIVAGFFIALSRLAVQRPAIIMSAGSFVAVPVHVAAWLLRIPTVVYQQDAQLGLANRLMAPLATVRAATTTNRLKLFKQSAVVTGFALRPDLATGNAAKIRQRYGLDPAWKTLLVIGGSSGAQHLNELVIQGLSHYPQQLNIIHIAGVGKTVPTQRPGYKQLAFTNADLPDLYAVADLVLCRAGSNVLAEVLALGKPCIIVPLPHTHQEQNARELATAGARTFHEADLTPAALTNHIRAALSDAAFMASASEKSQNGLPVDGAAQLANILLTYL